MLLIGGSEVAPASIPSTRRVCPVGLKANQMSNANDDKSPLSRAKMATTRAFKPRADEDVARFEAHHACRVNGVARAGAVPDPRNLLR